MRQFFNYTSLNVLGMFGISCYILADTFFVANGIGADGLAALNLAIPVYSFIHGCGLMLGIGGATKYTIAMTQGEQQRAHEIFASVLTLALLLAAGFMGVGLLLSDRIALLLGADAALFDMTEAYLKVILLFAPFFMVNELLLAFVRTDGSPALAMTAMVCGSLANIVLDYVFIYPLGMGIFGAVLATGIAPIISMLILSLHKLKGRCGFHFRLPRLTREHCCGSMMLGFPSLVTEVSSGLVIILFNRIILELSGNVGVAAYGIIANIALVTTAVYTGIAQGIQPLLSTAHGSGRPDDIGKYTTYAMVTVAVISVSVYGGLCSFAPQVTALFNGNGNETLQHMAEIGLRLYFISIPFTGVNVVLAGCFTSTDRPMPAHATSLLRGLVVVIPMAYGLAHVWGLNGVWLAVPLTELLVAACSALLWKKNLDTTKMVTQNYISHFE